MAIGLNADTEYLRRSSIPSGGAGTLTDGAFANTFVGVWLYRPTSGNTYSLTSDGPIIHGQAGAREIKLGFDNTFGGGGVGDPLLHAIFDSGGGAGSTQTFASGNILDAWIYYFYYETGGNQVFGYVPLSNLTTGGCVTLTRANSNAGSQYINTLTIGNNSGASAVVMGHYAYARARYDSSITLSDVVAWASSTTTEAGDWAFWPLDDNTDSADDSGNSRTLTLTGTLTSETSPTLSAGPTYTLAADASSMTLTGTAASLLYAHLLPADAGSLTLTGTAAGLLRQYPLTADGGSLTLSGTDAGLTWAHRLAADAGSLTLSGTDAALNWAHVLGADAGSLTLTGTDADLTVSTNRTLAAEAGTLTLTGTDAALVWSHVLPADSGTLSLTGTDAGLFRALLATAEPGALTLAGTDAALVWARRLDAESGALALTGTDADLTFAASGDKTLDAEPGTLTLSGVDAALTWIPAAPTGGGGGRRKRKVVLRINGQRYVGLPEDFEQIAEQAVEAAPEVQVPAVVVELPRDERDATFKAEAAELGQKIEATMRRVQEVRRQRIEDEEILEFL